MWKSWLGEDGLTNKQVISGIPLIDFDAIGECSTPYQSASARRSAAAKMNATFESHLRA